MVLTLAGRLSDCMLLYYRTRAESLASILPRGLEPVTYNGWGFWNVMAGRIERMRPAGWPSLVGLNLQAVAYRILVKAAVAGGQSVQGLYTIRTDVDRLIAAHFGKALSEYHVSHGDIRLKRHKHSFSLEVQHTRGGDGDCWLHAAAMESSRRTDSCFRNSEETAAFLRYRPLLVSQDSQGLKLTLVYRDEPLWNETGIHVREGRFGFFDLLNQQVALERATWLAPVEYRWRIGIRPSQVYGSAAARDRKTTAVHEPDMETPGRAVA